ncbi:TPA: hypothetical protein DIV55_01855 [Patescibacteria group bacterium]|uniref:Uncharacterized protein n=1 Tax=Candidatus Gottesmanbacteria bacterium GW2011_GWA1_43_11 TaxID=1618436 RepID=A0A0G1EST4_9BACT|nr:MAG: hypothetical protein UV59_C0002G0011 [Candidatus Gottesmanbacteria bacterium GW2011_GWA1_43_11]HCS78467.1 hypothetical protein [Patescibacteria group bacterium]
MTKRLFFFRSFFVLVIFLVTAAITTPGFTQETDDELVSKYGVQFPITELGGCASLTKCREFCEDPVNSSACFTFAEQKGFYEPEEMQTNKQKALARVKTELSCDSEISCRNFCEQPANFQKCSTFAKRHNIGGGLADVSTLSAGVEKVKEVLGCNSVSTCKSFCEQEVNQAKCSEAAQAVGLPGGKKQVGPGGCASEATCKTFCADPNNYKICQSFITAAGGNYRGVGGCDSEEACQQYCEKNPAACKSMSQNLTSTSYNPVDMCNHSPGCYWSNNTCNCTSASTQPLGPVDPAAQCVKYSGCVWSGSGCKCSTPIYTSGDVSPEARKNSCVSGGCTWNGTTCDCANSNGPAVMCGNKGCTWMNSACQCSSYGYPSASGYSGSGTTSGGTSSGSNMSKEQQEYYCKAGGGTCDWTSGICNCKGYSSSTTTSGSYFGSSMTNKQQEAACQAGGGSCDWSSGVCNCKNYSGSTTSGSSGSTSTSTGTSTTTTTTSTNMSREQQEQGCTSCGGTCTWNGDFCNCQCGSTSNSTTASPTVTQAASPDNDPATACQQSGGYWAGGQCYPNQVQGAWSESTMWERLVDYLNRLIGQR